MTGDSRFLRTIRLRNVLSFGADSPALELGRLNVLIGPNGAGKSNLIDSLSILHAAPGDLLEPIQAGGGIAEWLWKGVEGSPVAEIDVSVAYPVRAIPLRHRLALTMIGQRAEVADEAVENDAGGSFEQGDAFHYYRYRGGRPVLNVKSGAASGSNYSEREIRREDLLPNQSIVSQRKDPDQYPELTYLGREYSKIRLYREWKVGHNSQSRRPQATDLPSDFLMEDGSNLALVLNDLETRSNFRKRIVDQLKNADEAIVGFSTRVSGGTIQLYLHYAGLQSPVAATRISDGTLRYLRMLAVLCHPEPPPLVCIEEPELGLHPDLLPGLADLLREASERMQVIVTTHSDTLVDAMSQTPEAVIVCEKHRGETVMKRKTRAELASWLDEYGLGQLWRSGEIGGNRW